MSPEDVGGATDNVAHAIGHPHNVTPPRQAQPACRGRPCEPIDFGLHTGEDALQVRVR